MGSTIIDETRIQYVEGKPQADWFVTMKNAAGEREIFLRLQVTGFYPRGIGPFKSQEEALEVLDCILGSVDQALTECLGEDHRLRCVAEDALATRYLSSLSETHRHKAPAGRKGR